MKNWQFYAIVGVLVSINSNVVESTIAELCYGIASIGLLFMAIHSYASDKS